MDKMDFRTFGRRFGALIFGEKRKLRNTDNNIQCMSRREGYGSISSLSSFWSRPLTNRTYYTFIYLEIISFCLFSYRFFHLAHRPILVPVTKCGWDECQLQLLVLSVSLHTLARLLSIRWHSWKWKATDEW